MGPHQRGAERLFVGLDHNGGAKREQYIIAVGLYGYHRHAHAEVRLRERFEPDPLDLDHVLCDCDLRNLRPGRGVRHIHSVCAVLIILPFVL